MVARAASGLERMIRLLERYRNEIRSALREELEIRNDMAVPCLTKVIVSAGTGSPATDKSRIEAAMADLSLITGQKPQVRRARMSVSNFKLRKDMEVGCRVTLRGKRMYEFVDRLLNTAVPRLRDFRGLNPRSFDGRGNYSMGIPDQSIFPEIDPTKITNNQGMNVTFVTTAGNDSHARALLTRLGMPFRRAEEQSI
jgi:large subunit ribosomal protein L5